MKYIIVSGGRLVHPGLFRPMPSPETYRTEIEFHDVEFERYCMSDVEMTVRNVPSTPPPETYRDNDHHYRTLRNVPRRRNRK